MAQNIRSLGYHLKDIKVLLHSHEHFDHAAGTAYIQSQSGAQLFASAQAAPVLETGTVTRMDPQYGMHDPFPAARVDRLIESGETIQLGAISLVALATPGHSPGALSWQWESCEADQCYSLVYADSLSPVSSKQYRFSDHLSYLQAYRSGLKTLSNLSCDILLTPHPSASQMVKRLRSGNSLIEPEGCSNYANSISVRLEKRLEKEVSQSTE